MELFANLMSTRYDPRDFARMAEEGGYHGVTCSDHYWLDHGYPHVWVSLAAMACATTQIKLAPSFANNLLRSPVEFAQASVSMQRLAHGRFEAGLGAGWTENELVATGQRYPGGRERARRYREALQIARAIFTEGSCSYHGEYYSIETPQLGVPEQPIPLVASVGSPWTIANITPVVDRVELKFGRTTRNGQIDLDVMATVSRSELEDMIAQVRAANPAIGIGLFVLTAIGTGERTRQFKQTLGGNLLGGFVGEPHEVLDSIAALEQLGITRVQLSEVVKGSIETLAAHL